MAGGRGGRAAASAREEADAEKREKDGDVGPGGVLGGPGVSESYVAAVWTPAKPPPPF